jgi:hypothetical protein
VCLILACFWFKTKREEKAKQLQRRQLHGCKIDNFKINFYKILVNFEYSSNLTMRKFHYFDFGISDTIIGVECNSLTGNLSKTTFY